MKRITEPGVGNLPPFSTGHPARHSFGEYFDPGFNFADSLDSQFDSDFEALSVALFGQLAFDVSDAGKPLLLFQSVFVMLPESE